MELHSHVFLLHQQFLYHQWKQYTYQYILIRELLLWTRRLMVFLLTVIYFYLASLCCHHVLVLQPKLIYHLSQKIQCLSVFCPFTNIDPGIVIDGKNTHIFAFILGVFNQVGNVIELVFWDQF